MDLAGAEGLEGDKELQGEQLIFFLLPSLAFGVKCMYLCRFTWLTSNFSFDMQIFLWRSNSKRSLGRRYQRWQTSVGRSAFQVNYWWILSMPVFFAALVNSQHCLFPSVLWFDFASRFRCSGEKSRWKNWKLHHELRWEIYWHFSSFDSKNAAARGTTLSLHTMLRLIVKIINYENELFQTKYAELAHLRCHHGNSDAIEKTPLNARDVTCKCALSFWNSFRGFVMGLRLSVVVIELIIPVFLVKRA